MSRTILWIVLPVLLIVAVIAAFLEADPLRSFGAGVPPVEELTVERTVLDGNGIALRVRAGGSEPMEIAQVQVDGAYWAFTQDPPGSLGAHGTGMAAGPVSVGGRRDPSPDPGHSERRDI